MAIPGLGVSLTWSRRRRESSNKSRRRRESSDKSRSQRGQRSSTWKKTPSTARLSDCPASTAAVRFGKVDWERVMGWERGRGQESGGGDTGAQVQG